MPPKRQRDETSESERHTKRQRFSSDQISIKALQEVLKFRLSALSLHDIDRLQDAESLSLVAASISQIEKAFQHRWDIPDQLHSLDEEKRLRCQFPGCSTQTPFSKASNFTAHLQRCHAVLQPFIDQAKCFLCGKEALTRRALSGHEKAEHKLQYCVRAEIFTPYFAAFQDAEQWRQLLVKCTANHSQSMTPGDTAHSQPPGSSENNFSTSQTHDSRHSSGTSPPLISESTTGPQQQDPPPVYESSDDVLPTAFDGTSLSFGVEGIACTIDPSDIMTTSWDMPDDLMLI